MFHLFCPLILCDGNSSVIVMNNQEATVEEAVAAAAAERETDEDELEEVVGDTDAISAIGTSQLLFDIVTEEENHDLITLVTCFDLFPYP